MGLTKDLVYFALTEFKHPELVEASAAQFLDDVRGAYGQPLTLTDDARLPGDMPPGGSPNSLHYVGRAFDLHWSFTDTSLWRFVDAVFEMAAAHHTSVELELVYSATDHHVHLGVFPDRRSSRLLVRAD